MFIILRAIILIFLSCAFAYGAKKNHLYIRFNIGYTGDFGFTLKDNSYKGKEYQFKRDPIAIDSLVGNITMGYYLDRRFRVDISSGFSSVLTYNITNSSKVKFDINNSYNKAAFNCYNDEQLNAAYYKDVLLEQEKVKNKVDKLTKDYNDIITNISLIKKKIEIEQQNAKNYDTINIVEKIKNNVKTDSFILYYYSKMGLVDVVDSFYPVSIDNSEYFNKDIYNKSNEVYNSCYSSNYQNAEDAFITTLYYLNKEFSIDVKDDFRNLLDKEKTANNAKIVLNKDDFRNPLYKEKTANNAKIVLNIAYSNNIDIDVQAISEAQVSIGLEKKNIYQNNKNFILLKEAYLKSNFDTDYLANIESFRDTFFHVYRVFIQEENQNSSKAADSIKELLYFVILDTKLHSNSNNEKVALDSTNAIIERVIESYRVQAVITLANNIISKLNEQCSEIESNYYNLLAQEDKQYVQENRNRENLQLSEEQKKVIKAQLQDAINNLNNKDNQLNNIKVELEEQQKRKMVQENLEKKYQLLNYDLAKAKVDYINNTTIKTIAFPIMFNLEYDFINTKFCTIFLGAGLGVSLLKSYLDVPDYVFNSLSLAAKSVLNHDLLLQQYGYSDKSKTIKEYVNQSSLNIMQSKDKFDISLAYQFYIGLSKKIYKLVSFDLIYGYIDKGTSNLLEKSVEDSFWYRNGQQLKHNTHNITFGITYNF